MKASFLTLSLTVLLLLAGCVRIYQSAAIIEFDPAISESEIRASVGKLDSSITVEKVRNTELYQLIATDKNSAQAGADRANHVAAKLLENFNHTNHPPRIWGKAEPATSATNRSIFSH